MAEGNSFLHACRSATNLRRAASAALLVGPILALINQTPFLWRLLHGVMLPPLAALRISLTFAVPFVVSLYSSAMADARKSRSARQGVR